MFYNPENNTYIQLDTPFTIGDVQYDKTWLRTSSLKDKNDLGLQEVITIGEWKDNKYFFNSEEFVGIERRLTSIPRELKQIKEQKEQEIRNDGASKLALIANPYQSYERESWSIQADEANSFIKDSNAITPLIDALSEARGISKLDLSTKIIENNNLFRSTCGTVLGNQQKRLDLLSLATTIEEVMSI